jgi:aldose 1-epimerase
MIHLKNGDTTAQVDPSFGNIVVSFAKGGHEHIWKPDPWNEPTLAGIPLLAPWANRLDGDAYTANGARYQLNPEFNNLRRDGNHLPIHGLLIFANAWHVVTQHASSVTSRLEFWRFPKWMAQFPFAHTIEITHRLQPGSLEIETAIENLSNEPMPLSLGYHPYLKLTDSPRDQWVVHIAARDQVVLSPKLIPTGERHPMSLPTQFPLAGNALDNVFSNLTGEAFLIEGARERISVRFGPKFKIAVIYAPQGRDFVCIEPMTAPTNAFNSGAPELQSIPAGEIWRESFQISIETF